MKVDMKRNLVTSILMTIATTILLGILYPLVVTGVSQALFPEKSNGSLIQRDGTVIGSRLIGQPFTGPGYFHSRPSAAGDAGYDATASGGSNLGPTNQKLIARVEGDVARMQAENPALLIPVDLVTASGSGLDPEITPAAAYFQVPRVARERQRTEEDIRKLVAAHVAGRQWDIFGEPRVNVLELNLSLESLR